MKGYEKFEAALIEAAKEHVKPLRENEKSEFAEVFKNHLLNRDGPKRLRRPSNSYQQYFWNLFQGFMEISKSLEALEDVGFYIRRFPFQGTRISRERYLQFHVEAHYSEMYILRDRLTRFAKVIARQFKKDPGMQNAQKRCQSLVDSITKSLDGVIDIRRRHVHEIRFKDDGIERLGTIGLLSRSGNDEMAKLMKEYYRYEFSQVRKHWKDLMKKNLSAIRELLSGFFELLYPIVFDENSNSMRYPSGVRT